MLGGFTTNFIWCIGLNMKNGSGYEYLATKQRHSAHGRDRKAIENPIDAPSEERVEPSIGTDDSRNPRIPMLANYLFSALAGTTWYFQFFFYTMGESKMKIGNLGYTSWSLHMASIIIFSTMWGWIFHEWKGSSKKAHRLIFSGIATLILSTIIIGVGAYLKGDGH